VLRSLDTDSLNFAQVGFPGGLSRWAFQVGFPGGLSRWAFQVGFNLTYLRAVREDHDFDFVLQQ
jgi:hypothetical protein